jgi:transposase InsO family protein
MPQDNAVMESIVSSPKHELTHRERFESRTGAWIMLFDCIELFYNRKRLQGALGYRSPA